MSFQIDTNIGALGAYNALKKANADTLLAQTRIATRKRINQVSDDVSGFNVGKSLETKVQLMQAAKSNIASAKNMLSTAESALTLIKDKITQIRGYIADASDPTKDREAIANNIKSLGEEIKNILETTKFNDTKLLAGTTAATKIDDMANASISTIAKSFTFQTGADVSDRINLDFASAIASTLATGTAADASKTAGGGGVSADVANAISSLTHILNTGSTHSGAAIDDSTGVDFATAIASLSSAGPGTEYSKSILGKFENLIDEALGKIGNFTQRLDVKDDYLDTAILNAQASVSRLFDADMAMEQLNATKSQIGSSVATQMLSTLNFAPQNVLGLFQ